MPTARRKATPKAKPVPKVRKQTLVQLLLPDSDGDDYRIILGPQEYGPRDDYTGEQEAVKEGHVRIIAPCGNEDAQFKISDLRDLLEHLPAV